MSLAPCPPGEACGAYRAVMSLHKLTPGDGYTYLSRQVAAADATHQGHASLGDFYAAKGESPGVWAGSGLSGLDGVDAGQPVSAAQLKALFGQGRHPNADAIGAAMITAGHSPAQALASSKLGPAFYTYDQKAPLRVEVAGRLARHNKRVGAPRNAPIAADVRARIRTDAGAEMFVDWHGRPPADLRELSGFIAGSSRRARTAVAGYDLTFSPVKSVSALWAIAPPEVAAQIQEAHQGAVANTVGWLEREAAFTRACTAHRVREIDVTGLITAAFTHRDARSGDPDLHTHVAVSNKVQTLDGLWLALRGRVLFKAASAASERYDTRVEAELIARLGVHFEARAATDTFMRPVREVVGVDPALNASWSSRRADIVVRRDVLSAAFQVNHGRRPTINELRHLARHATLQTRAAKHSPRSYADQRATWRDQAQEVLGGGGAVEAMIAAAIGSRQRGRSPAGPSPSGQWVGQTAAAVVAKVSQSRPAWQVWHVRAEAEWAARSAGVALADVDVAVDQVVACALSGAHCVPLGMPEPAADPGARRRDGSSVYTVPGAARFTSRTAGDGQAHLLTVARRPDGPAPVVQVAVAGPDISGVAAGPVPPQRAAQTTASGARPQLGPSPRPGRARPRPR